MFLDNQIIIKLSLVLFFILIVKGKSSYEYCINPITDICPGLEKIPISKYKITKAREEDYYLDPEAKADRERYPDFMALTMIQNKGLCSFGGESRFITDIPDIRYGRTYQCYYAYQNLLCDDVETKKSSSKVHKSKLPTLCKKQCYQYYNSLVTFLNDNDRCPVQFSEEYVHPKDVFQERVKYTDKLREFCDKAEDTEDCFILSNERNNCGFINKDLAADYCIQNDDNDECCSYFYSSHKEIYVRNSPMIPLIFGVATFLGFTITGLIISFQIIKEIKQDEKEKAFRSVEKMFINNNSTSTSINSMDSGSQQSFPVSITTNESNMTALNAMSGSCPNIPMIMNEANNSNPALNSPAMNLYRMNRHNKNKSNTSLVNLYGQAILKTPSVGRNIRKKKQVSSANMGASQVKNNKKKKFITSSEAHQLYPRTTSNADENKSVGSAGGLPSSGFIPYSIPNGSYSSVNLNANNRNSGDSHNLILDKKAVLRKSSLPQLSHSSGHDSPIPTRPISPQDIDAESTDITNVKTPSKVNSVDSYAASEPKSLEEKSNENQNTSETSTSKESKDTKQDKPEKHRGKYSKRSASLHAASVKDLRLDSVKIQQMQQHILQQQQQILQKQQQQQQLLQQQTQPQTTPQQLYYLPPNYTTQPPYSPSSVYPPPSLSQPLPYNGIPPQMVIPKMTSPKTVTPLPQQFTPTTFVPNSNIIPTQAMTQAMTQAITQAMTQAMMQSMTQPIAPALPVRHKSMQNLHKRSSSVKSLHHKNSAPLMSRKYSLPSINVPTTSTSINNNHIPTTTTTATTATTSFNNYPIPAATIPATTATTAYNNHYIPATTTSATTSTTSYNNHYIPATTTPATTATTTYNNHYIPATTTPATTSTTAINNHYIPAKTTPATAATMAATFNSNQPHYATISANNALPSNSKTKLKHQISDSSLLTNISGESSSYFTDISSEVRTEDSMLTVIPSVVDSGVASTIENGIPTVIETMVNSPLLSEVNNQGGPSSTTSILKKSGSGASNEPIHHSDSKEPSSTTVSSYAKRKPQRKKRSFVITNGDITSEDEGNIKEEMEEKKTKNKEDVPVVKKRAFIVTNGVIASESESESEKENEKKKEAIEEDSLKKEKDQRVTKTPNMESRYTTSKRKKDKMKKFFPSSRRQDYIVEAVKSFYPNEYSKDLKVLPGMKFKIMEEIHLNEFWIYVENMETGEKGNIPINCLAIKES